MLAESGATNSRTDTVLFGLEDLDALAGAWLTETAGTLCWFIDGDLGAGKTTLVQALCRHLGVTEPVASPTYGLVHTYTSPVSPVHHIDLYRIGSMEEAFDAGLYEYVMGSDYCFVEWAGRLPDLRPDRYLHLILTAEPDGRRCARLSLHS